MEAVKTVMRGNIRAFITYDSDPESPRQWENATTLWCWHRRYNLGDYRDSNRPREAIQTEEELRSYVAALGTRVLSVAPLYLYDHSGITMKTSPFGCRWDSGQVGWAFVTSEHAKTMGVLKGKRKWAANAIESEVEVYDQYLRGDVYGYVVERVDSADTKVGDGEDLDSCWGFFGEEHALEEMNSALARCVKHERVSRFNRLKELIRSKIDLALRPGLLGPAF